MTGQEREALDLSTEERLALGLRTGAAGINDMDRALTALEGPDQGGDNTLRRLNEAAFIGEHYGRAVWEDWRTLLAHVRGGTQFNNYVGIRDALIHVERARQAAKRDTPSQALSSGRIAAICENLRFADELLRAALAACEDTERPDGR